MRILFYAIWLLILAVFQPTLARGIEICGIAPNLFLCFVIMCGFSRGKYEASVCGIIFGLAYDLLVGRIIGVSSLIYLYLGFGSGILSERFASSSKRVAGALSAAIGTILAAMVYFLANRFVYDVSFVTAVFRIAFPEAIYNATVSFLLTFPMFGMMKLMRINRIS